MTNLTFEQLVAEYCSNHAMFVDVSKSADFIRSCHTSKMSCDWSCGTDIQDSGWVQISTPSASSKADKRPVFVAKRDAYIKAIKGGDHD